MRESIKNYEGPDGKKPAPKKKPYNSTPAITRTADEYDREAKSYTRLRG